MGNASCVGREDDAGCIGCIDRSAKPEAQQCRAPRAAPLSAPAAKPPGFARALAALQDGNRKFMTTLGNGPMPPPTPRLSTASPRKGMGLQGPHGLSHGRAQPWVAIVLCSPTPVTVDRILSLRDDEAVVTCSVGDAESSELGPSAIDGCVASVEFALSSEELQVILVLELSSCPAVEASLLEAQDCTKAAAPHSRPATEVVGKLRIGDMYGTVEAMEQRVVWSTIEHLFSSSHFLCNAARARGLTVQGAVLEPSTGRVMFLGEHVRQDHLTDRHGGPPHSLSTSDFARPPSDPPVPAEEALAVLTSGNMRSVRQRRSGNGRSRDWWVRRPEELSKAEAEQNHVAMVIHGKDLKGSMELLFDTKPGAIITLNLDGPLISAYRNLDLLKPSIEFGLSARKSRLIVVLGEEPRPSRSTQAHVDRDTPNMQVQMQAGVFGTMEQLLMASKPLRRAIADGEVQLHGAIFSGVTGEVFWVGEHPRQESLIARYVMQREGCPVKLSIPAACPSIDALKAGNIRFVSGLGGRGCATDPRSGRQTAVQEAMQWAGRAPLAIVLSGGDSQARTPERVFDIAPGELVVQRLAGTVAGRRGGGLQRSLEHLLSMREAQLLLVISDTLCMANVTALKQAKAELGLHKAAGPQTVLDQLSVPAARTLADAQARVRAVAGADEEVLLAAMAQHSTLYAIERLLVDSDVIRNAVIKGAVRIQGGVIHPAGDVQFLGAHPRQAELLFQLRSVSEREERMNYKG